MANPSVGGVSPSVILANFDLLLVTIKAHLGSLHLSANVLSDGIDADTGDWIFSIPSLSVSVSRDSIVQ